MQKSAKITKMTENHESELKHTKNQYPKTSNFVSKILFQLNEPKSGFFACF